MGRWVQCDGPKPEKGNRESHPVVVVAASSFDQDKQNRQAGAHTKVCDKVAIVHLAWCFDGLATDMRNVQRDSSQLPH